MEIQEQKEREHLLLENIPLVRSIARGIHLRMSSHMPLEDFVQAGFIGLMDALYKYDPAKQVPFSAYASLRIRGAILDSLREGDWAPRSMRRKARLLDDAHNELRMRLGREPTEVELAAEFDIDLHGLQLLLGRIDSLHVQTLRVRPWDGDEEELDLCEFLADDAETPLIRCLRSEALELLNHALTALTERERLLLKLYYQDELTMRKVGEVLGVGVSGMHSLAVMRLRTRLVELVGDGPLGERKA
jgi:RNA polymerase sigma factor for flagellar operon FliA